MRTLLLLALLLAGCTTSNTVTIPLAPAWRQPLDARPLTAYEVRSAVQANAPYATVDVSDDATYTRISYDWLQRYVSWTWESAKAIGVTYTSESFDCENFTRLFNEIVRLKAAQAGVKAAPLCAEVHILPPTGAHSVVGVGTDKGIFLIEPQPDAGPFRIKPLAAYPYLITAVKNL